MDTSNKTIEKFYDNFSIKLINDYLQGNKRMESALTSALKFLDFNGKKVLDIGCGIGWSCHEFSKSADQVVGIDLSPRLVNIASQIFHSENIEFKNIDVTSNDFQKLQSESFDIITMLDVFEHIPLQSRKMFISALNKLLKPGGIVFMACPSIYHQQFLKKNNPAGLQPVDEDISIDDVNEISKDMNGDVLYFAYKKIWRENDYFHSIIQKHPVKNTLKNNNIKLDSFLKRRHRISTLKDFSDEVKKPSLKTIFKKDVLNYIKT